MGPLPGRNPVPCRPISEARTSVSRPTRGGPGRGWLVGSPQLALARPPRSRQIVRQRERIRPNLHRILQRSQAIAAYFARNPHLVRFHCRPLATNLAESYLFDTCRRWTARCIPEAQNGGYRFAKPRRPPCPVLTVLFPNTVGTALKSGRCKPKRARLLPSPLCEPVALNTIV